MDRIADARAQSRPVESLTRLLLAQPCPSMSCTPCCQSLCPRGLHVTQVGSAFVEQRCRPYVTGDAELTSSRECSQVSLIPGGSRPLRKPTEGSFLFLGPTGVGKTGLTLEFARYLFGEDHVFRFDMSEFLHLDSVKLFMGDDSGGVGRLGKVLSKHHKGVLLFDEIEKAHRLIWDLFLQMLDVARITLADHRTYNLSGFYMVCTCNIGSQQLLRPTRLPFTALERAVVAELHRFFRPELIGRFNEKIVFDRDAGATHVWYVV